MLISPWTWLIYPMRWFLGKTTTPSALSLIAKCCKFEWLKSSMSFGLRRMKTFRVGMSRWKMRLHEGSLSSLTRLCYLHCPHVKNGISRLDILRDSQYLKLQKEMSEQQQQQQQEQQEQQQQQSLNSNASNSSENYQHNSLLNPLPSYIGRSMSTQSSEHSADDSLPVFTFIPFDPDHRLLLGSQQHPPARLSLDTARDHHPHSERHAFLALSCSPCCGNRPCSLSDGRGRAVCLGRWIQRTAWPRSFCSIMRISAQCRVCRLDSHADSLV